MKKNKDVKKKSGIGKFLVGGALGAALGILLAPKAGSETRRDLKKKMNELIEKLKNIDSDEVKENIEAKIFQIKSELADLDKEKALAIAKKKANDIKDMAEELVNYAVSKGTPVVEEAASAVRDKAILVTKEVLDKLEKGKK